MKLTGNMSFEELVEISTSVDVSGRDFSWLNGRATEERPRWGYARILAKRLATASLDIQPGGGEKLAEAPQRCQLPALFPRGSFAPTISE